MSENQKTATKRKFLKGIGAAAVGTAGVAASTGSRRRSRSPKLSARRGAANS